MSFFIYQRCDPRYKDWIPLTTQQFRLRNIVQVLAVNLKYEDQCSAYFTMHTTPMSAPFFTSEKITGTRNITLVWKEIEIRQISDFVRLSSPGCTIRVWLEERNEPLYSWGIYFNGLHYLGRRGDFKELAENSLVLRTPVGFFTSLESVVPVLIAPHRFSTFLIDSNNVKPSYTVKMLAALHRVQRSVLDERGLAQTYKQKLGFYGYAVEPHSSNDGFTSFASSQNLGGKALQRFELGRKRIQLKEEIEASKFRVSFLSEEKGRAEGRLLSLKREPGRFHDRSSELMAKVYELNRDRERLKEMKLRCFDEKQELFQASSRSFLRKRQLISELLVIYPIVLVKGSQRYSINGVQLPNAEDYGNEGGGQISVALGYTAHLVAMLAFFLDIPLRYPIRHFGSRSRIVDHITTQIPEKEREFPLYFKGRKDIYVTYAIYLLNMNISQIRWFCGLSTPDVRKTLPNIYDLLTSRLIIPNWPPDPEDVLEVAQEITEDLDEQLYRNDFARSLDEGLNKIHPDKEDQLKMQAYLRASFSDLHGAGSNSVALGDLNHSRAQDRFLSRWRKHTYSETEDIDTVSKFLTNHLELPEKSTDRRPSLNLPPPITTPNLVITSSSDQPSTSRRRRRYGQVVSPQLSESSDKDERPSFSNNPGLNIDSIERHINNLERRKSVCEGSRSPVRRKTPSPTQKSGKVEMLPPLHLHLSADDDNIDEAVEDIVRRISLTDFEIHQRISGEENLVGDVEKNRSNDKECEFVASGSQKDEIVSTSHELKLTEHSVRKESGEKIYENFNTEEQHSQLLMEHDKCLKLEKNCDITKEEDNVDDPDSDLWARTEALLNCQSFNFVRRRVSESN